MSFVLLWLLVFYVLVCVWQVGGEVEWALLFSESLWAGSTEILSALDGRPCDLDRE